MTNAICNKLKAHLIINDSEAIAIAQELAQQIAK